MSKPPGWGALQKQYLADYARSGISPAAWCKAKGLNYATARRYIKYPSKDAQSDAHNTAQKELRTAQKKTAQSGKGKSAEKKTTPSIKKPRIEIESDPSEFIFDPSDYGINDQQAHFVSVFLATGDKYIAYRNAGYKCEGETGKAAARRLYRNVSVYRAIRDGLERRQKRYTAELDEIVHQLVAITKADPNELSQFRRVNCRYCWGEKHLYQWRDIGEFDQAAEKAAKDSKPEPEYGGVGFIENDDPNPDCPKCEGEGKGHVHIADTRGLIGTDVHYLYTGIKQTLTGIQVLTEDKAAARRDLLKLLAVTDRDRQLQELQIENQRLVNARLAAEVGDGDDEPLPVVININVVDARGDTDEPDA
ncbi:terminase small subunit [Serratia sp. JSRIV004]|uniref:terminase small subunit n=1 Tax=Serratia sp. JSRIV004 TaxID=2831895 RepID=UPI001CBB413C|nr:terminase small subunit [Serratia sp. JSRIV004]UAN55354.1 terminase small subunit [Serratia sp. JSRIV004]